ncbi:hypothetical protein AWU82_29825 [Pseudomonas glycinae]|uniref:Uncharacterized protein n=1 Tax=Pseudomonas glycinae TaxID=1785145 RepID=A0ABN5FUT6_9PSED|nr:hypothetical protein AWU82_29825 [Pseudomonas glycinae]
MAVVARFQNNDQLLPSFMQSSHVLYDGQLSGELLSTKWISLMMLINGYLIGIVLEDCPDDAGIHRSR